MILVDTSVWIDHFRFRDEGLVSLLESRQVVNHHFVTGELACGNLHNRELILKMFKSLPQTLTATEEEVLHFMEKQQLIDQGLGYIDCHLLTATALTPSTRLWTRDRRLKAAAASLNLIYNAVEV
ncbi:MAG: type II toxin-antitoxin system VapC family toxin [SAR324 cluster bacterium]|nr:type II toxin-antitoxin system VapC family toxin [SAR324 cluster bacterium]MBL7035412.1 type II toxin-antitoxin system VapC family toxin [SAR324 cluster bacterium]